MVQCHRYGAGSYVCCSVIILLQWRECDAVLQVSCSVIYFCCSVAHMLQCRRYVALSQVYCSVIGLYVCLPQRHEDVAVSQVCCSVVCMLQCHEYVATLARVSHRI